MADEFDVEAEVRAACLRCFGRGVVHDLPVFDEYDSCTGPCPHCTYTSKMHEAMRRAIAHGRQLGVEEMRERAAQVCEKHVAHLDRRIDVTADDTTQDQWNMRTTARMAWDAAGKAIRGLPTTSK